MAEETYLSREEVSQTFKLSILQCSKRHREPGAFATPSGEEGQGYVTVIIHTAQNQEIKWEIKSKASSQSKDVSTDTSKLKEMVSQVLLLPT